MISTKSRYGLRALIDLAVNYRGNPVYLRNIATREGISTRYLENIFTRLRAAGILKSVKGKKGGFLFAKTLDSISLLDIIEILEDTTFFPGCVDSPDSCKNSADCISREVWVYLDRHIRNLLAGITLETLVNKKNSTVQETDKKYSYNYEVFTC